MVANTSKRLFNPNKAEAQVTRKKINKGQHLRDVVEWCQEHNVHGYSAIKSKFPRVLCN